MGRWDAGQSLLTRGRRIIGEVEILMQMEKKREGFFCSGVKVDRSLLWMTFYCVDSLVLLVLSTRGYIFANGCEIDEASFRSHRRAQHAICNTANCKSTAKACKTYQILYVYGRLTLSSITWSATCLLLSATEFAISLSAWFTLSEIFFARRLLCSTASSLKGVTMPNKTLIS